MTREETIDWLTKHFGTLLDTLVKTDKQKAKAEEDGNVYYAGLYHGQGMVLSTEMRNISELIKMLRGEDD